MKLFFEIFSHLAGSAVLIFAGFYFAGIMIESTVWYDVLSNAAGMLLMVASAIYLAVTMGEK